MNKEVSVSIQLSEQKPVKAPRPARKRIIWCSVVALAVVALFSFSLRNKGGRATKSDAVAKRRTIPDEVALEPEQQANITTDTVKIGNLPVRTSVPGRVDFDENHMTPVFAQFAGRIVRLDAEVGFSVREGQVLRMLDYYDCVGLHIVWCY